MINIYEKLTPDITKHFTLELKTLLTHLDQTIQKAVMALIPEKAKPGAFYTIPRLHKLPKSQTQKPTS